MVNNYTKIKNKSNQSSSIDKVKYELIIKMTKNNTNSTITKLLLLNVRDLLRQQTCGDAHSKVMFSKEEKCEQLLWQ